MSGSIAIDQRRQVVPPLPFNPYVKRSYSNQSRSTMSGTPTPYRSYREAVEENDSTIGVKVCISLPRSRSPVGGLSTESPCCIRRSAIASKDPTYVPPETSTTRQVYFERKYPPMPKLKSIYTEAKKAEYDGNVELAAELYLKAIQEGDRVDSSIKDYAGILHMKGDTKAAIEFMESQAERRKVSHGFKNLLAQLKSTYDREQSNEGSGLPHIVLMTIEGEGIGTSIEYESLRALLPNCLKITRITFVNAILKPESGLPSSRRALIEFGSHSAARKAVMVSKHEAIKCVWAAESLIDPSGLVSKDPVQLVKGGPKVDIRFATVPLGFIAEEWPKLLQGHPSQAAVVSTPPPPVFLPAIPDRGLLFSETRSGQSWSGSTASRPRSMALDMTEIYDNVDSTSCASMDWCMNTPSPVKHMACLL